MQRIIDEIKGCLEHQYYFAALILSLAIPDVCLSYEEKKVKNLDSYSEWCKKWFDRDFDISGEVVYALRCAMVHSLNSDIENQRIYQEYRRDKKQEDRRKEHFRFYIPNSDTQAKITYIKESRKSVEHELCISRLIYQIIGAYEKFQNVYPDFKYNQGKNWI